MASTSAKSSQDNPRIMEVEVTGYPSPYGAKDDTWFIDFQRMKTFDANGKQVFAIGRRSTEQWFFGAPGSKHQTALPNTVSECLEAAYVLWLNREITG